MKIPSSICAALALATGSTFAQTEGATLIVSEPDYSPSISDATLTVSSGVVVLGASARLNLSPGYPVNPVATTIVPPITAAPPPTLSILDYSPFAPTAAGVVEFGPQNYVLSPSGATLNLGGFSATLLQGQYDTNSRTAAITAANNSTTLTQVTQSGATFSSGAFNLSGAITFNSATTVSNGSLNTGVTNSTITLLNAASTGTLILSDSNTFSTGTLNTGVTNSTLFIASPTADTINLNAIAAVAASTVFTRLTLNTNGVLSLSNRFAGIYAGTLNVSPFHSFDAIPPLIGPTMPTLTAYPSLLFSAGPVVTFPDGIFTIANPFIGSGSIVKFGAGTLLMGSANPMLTLDSFLLGGVGSVSVVNQGFQGFFLEADPSVIGSANYLSMSGGTVFSTIGATNFVGDSTVPEPTSGALLALAAIGLLGKRRRTPLR